MPNKYKNKLVKFYRRHKRMPSYAEIASIFDFSSKNAAFKIIKAFIEEGFIRKDEKGKLIPGDTFNTVKILGSIEAGFPTPAEEELADTMSLDEYLIKNKEASFILRVSGQSMKDAGIIDGDMVVVERNRTPKVGDIVVAEVDNEWTMKYLKRKGRENYLEPANKAFKPIHPKGELKIAAVVTAVVRKVLL